MKRYFSLILAIAATVSAQIVPSTGNVRGPTSATDNAVARYDGTTGKLIQNSGVTIDDSGNLTVSGTGTHSFAGPIGFPGDTRRGVTKVWNEATGDVYGIEQVTGVQTGGNPALRLLTSSAASAELVVGKYTSATAFTEFAKWDNSGNLTQSGNLTVSGTGTSSFAGIISQAQTGSDNNLSISSTGRYTTFNFKNSGTNKAQIFYDNTLETLTLGVGSSAGLVIAKDSGDATFAGNIKTAAPSGGTAATWRLGTVASVSPTSPNRTIEVQIGGTTYYIHAKTTND